MIEPLYWNPLPAAALWLAQRTGRAIEALTLVDIVASMGQLGDPAPTIIKAVLPRELKFAKLTMQAPEDSGTGDALHRFFSEMLRKQFGPLPVGMEYVGYVYPTVAPLCVNSLLDLLMHGTTELAVLTGLETACPHETVWLMPWGTSHHATIETCGINRSDLIELGNKLAKKYSRKEGSDPKAVEVHLPKWTVNKPQRFQGYVEPLYNALKDAHARGQPRPTVHEILEIFAANKPAQVAKVLPGEGLDYYTNDYDGTKTANLKAIRESIARMTTKKPR